MNANEQQWKAVVDRSRAADGRFFYAVKTTGVFCRPSCPSRRPRRENVLCFASCEEARRAGFRACLRCAPEQADGEARRTTIEAACRAIEAAERPPALAALADLAGLSRFHLLREFKRLVGMTPGEYYRWVRGRRLARSLGEGAAVDDAIYGAGFGSASRVYERTGDLLGMTPAVYRRGAESEVLRYGFADTPFGLMLVAATGRGICAIEFGASRRALHALLRERFSRAELLSPDAQLQGWIAAVARHVALPVGRLGLPLDLKGTVFQKKVWDALQRVPPGATVSYSELARRVGAPDAVRAVASACASNRLAVAIPCHRAVGSDGSLRGYRWGLERKRALLALESRPARKR